MKPLNTVLNRRGQALVELILVLPVFLVFLSATAVLLNYATLPIWLDELTTLYLRLPEIDDLHSKLKRTREGSMIPPYPAPQDLKKNTGEKNLFRVPLPLHRYYPGQTIRTEISLMLSQLLTRAFLPFGHLPGVNGPIRHALQMSPLKNFQKESIKDQMRQILFPGSVMEVIIGNLDALGIQPVHLNLDAIPEEKNPGDQNHEN